MPACAHSIFIFFSDSAMFEFEARQQQQQQEENQGNHEQPEENQRFSQFTVDGTHLTVGKGKGSRKGKRTASEMVIILNLFIYKC
jgi:hypothetical protein